jgi:phosphoadenosine phosphosulfate reductase
VQSLQRNGAEWNNLPTAQDFGSNDPGERLTALRRLVPGRIVLTTSFGLEDQALTHLIVREGLDIELITLDTGRLFPSTYRVWAETEALYARRIRSFHPYQSALAAHVADAGINGFYHSREARTACCHIRKVEPLERALEGVRAWVTGLRSDQSEVRGAVALTQVDAAGRLKFAPLFDWTRDQVADFCTREKVPVNELHGRGYLSIGCEPCTRAVRPGEPERAGRWWWEKSDSGECGLHVGCDRRPVTAGTRA